MIKLLAKLEQLTRFVIPTAANDEIIGLVEAVGGDKGNICTRMIYFQKFSYSVKLNYLFSRCSYPMLACFMCKSAIAWWIWLFWQTSVSFTCWLWGFFFNFGLFSVFETCWVLWVLCNQSHLQLGWYISLV